MPLAAGRGPHPGRSPCRHSRVSFAVSACVRMYSPASGKTLSDEPVGMKRDNEGARGRDMAPKDEAGMPLLSIEMQETTHRIEEDEILLTEETTLIIPTDEDLMQCEEFSSSPSDNQDDSCFPSDQDYLMPPTSSHRRGSTSGGSSSPGESTKVFVGNLAGDINEEELGRMFNPFGTVLEIVLHRRRSVLGSGSAFIRFAESHAAHAAIGAMNGSSKGRGRRSRLPLVVRIADPPKANGSGKTSPTENLMKPSQQHQPQSNLTEFRMTTKTMTRVPVNMSGNNLGPQQFHQRLKEGQLAMSQMHAHGQQTAKSMELGVLKQHNPYSFECYIEQETCWERQMEDEMINNGDTFAAYTSRDEPELLELEWAAGQETDGSSSFDSLPSLEWSGGRRPSFESQYIQHIQHPAYSHNMEYIRMAPPPSSATPHPPHQHAPHATTAPRAPSPYALATPPVLPPFTTPYTPSPKSAASPSAQQRSNSWRMPQPPAIPLREKLVRSTTPSQQDEDGATGGQNLPKSSSTNSNGLEWPGDADLLSTSSVGASLWDNMSRLLRPEAAALAQQALAQHAQHQQQINATPPLQQQHTPPSSSSRPPLHPRTSARPPVAFPTMSATPTPSQMTATTPAVGSGQSDNLTRFTCVLEHGNVEGVNGNGMDFTAPHFTTHIASGLGSDWVPHTEIPMATATAGHWGAHWA